MKYTLFFAALLLLGSCSKSKDHRIIVSGQLNPKSYQGSVNHSLLAFRYTASPLTTSNNVSPLADFTTDSLGYFRFELDASLGGDSISIFNREDGPAALTPTINIPKGVTEVNAGTVLLDTL